MENNFENLEQKFLFEFEKNNIDKSSTFILGISGGPDSMWLLNLMKNLNVIVACVNYNKRKDAWNDQKIVENFCSKNNIKCETLVLDKNQKYGGNFQKIARDQRYDFYQKIYNKYKASALILAHHKDDNLETYLFQKQSKRQPKNYGIANINRLLEMTIFRPMINLWFKDEILTFCNFFNIPYALDYTNFLPIYTRNKIRMELKEKTKIEKQELIDEMNFINKELEHKNLVVKDKYLNFKNSDYNYKLLDLEHEFINEILFEFLHDNIENVKVCRNKLNLFKNYIKSTKNFKHFKINNKNYVYKHQGQLKVDKI